MKDTPPLTATRPLAVAASLLVVSALWLAFAPAAHAKLLRPAVKLGPVVVLNGTATVTGTVRGIAPNEAVVTINGRPVGLNLNGTFVAVVDLGGRSALSIEVAHLLSGERSVVSIPVNTVIIGPGGIIPADILDSIERAAVSLLEPLGGFTIIDGRPIVIQGSVGDEDELVRLTINNVDVLKLLDALGGFAVPLPGTTKTITIEIVDSRNVTTIITLPVEHQASAPPPSATTPRTVKVAGLRIASVRYVTKHFRRTKRIQVIVTVKDTAGRAVRGARVQVRAASARSLRLKPKVKRTGIRGRVSFLIHPRSRVFGKRLTIVTVATAGTTKAQRKTSFRVPKPRTRAVTAKRG